MAVPSWFPDDGPLTGPIKLDNDAMLMWVKTQLGESSYSPAGGVYERLLEFPEYRALQENTALLERLRDVLVLDQRVNQKVKTNWRLYNLWTMLPLGKKHQFVGAQHLEPLKAERQKAYDNYEMLRRLSFDESGNIFRINLR